MTSFFSLLHTAKHSRARTGAIHTDHGDIATPAFMPVGTQATVKTLDQVDLEGLRAQMILGNTYHLHLRPGEDTVAELGGLHAFMNWPHPILTDSGGFQVFSLGLQKIKRQNDIDARPLPALSSAEARVHHPSFPATAGPRMAGGGAKDGSARLGERAKDNSQTQGRLVKIDDDGVTFTSHIDGSERRFTPEASIEIQHKLGADIIMAFDECTPDNASFEYAREAMERTHRWAARSFRAHQRLSSSVILSGAKDLSGSKLLDSSVAALPQNDKRKYRQFLFGIIQGANFRELREESARYIASLDFAGIAIGGESIGYNMEATTEILDWVVPLLPPEKPRYTMGVGLSPKDLLIAIDHGADMFDCVGPTRLARHGMVYVSPLSPSARGGARGGGSHRLNLKKSIYKKDARPIDETCSCPTCMRYSRAYLHHLFAAEETSALRLATLHNLHFMLNLMQQTREAIAEDRFEALKSQWL